MIAWHRRLQQWCLDRLILQPTTNPLEPGEQKLVSIDLKNLVAEKSALRIDSYVHGICEDESIDWLCLKFPGTGGRAERSTSFPSNLRSARQAGLRVETWTWNPPGYGNSPGRIQLKDLSKVSKLWSHEVLRLRVSDETKIWLVGNSLGCLSAMNAAIEIRQRYRNPIGLWLRNPPELSLVVPYVGQRWRAGKLLRGMCRSLPESTSAIQLARQCTFPAVFLMSELDRLVPPSMQSLIHDAYQGAKHISVLKNLGHDGMLDETHAQAVNQACDWLWAAAESQSRCKA